MDYNIQKSMGQQQSNCRRKKQSTNAYINKLKRKQIKLSSINQKKSKLKESRINKDKTEVNELKNVKTMELMNKGKS